MKLFSLIILSVNLVNGIHLPNNFPRCYRNDPLISRCIERIGNSLKSHLFYGVKQLELPPLKQVTLPKLRVKHVTRKSNIISATFHNLTFENMDQFELSNIQFNAEDVSLKGEINYKLLPVSCEFDSIGTLLGVSASGRKFFKGYMENVIGRFMTNGYLFKKRGTDFCAISNVRVDMKVGAMYGKFDPFEFRRFGVTEEFVKTNSQSVGEELESIFAKVFQLFLRNYLIRLCEQVPYNNIFPYYQK